MPEPSLRKFDVNEVAGGLNQGVAARHLSIDEWAELYNMYPWEKRLISRPGNDRVTNVAYTESGGATKIRSVGGFRDPDGNFTVVVGTERSLAKLDGLNLVILTSEDGLLDGAAAGNVGLWDFHQYNQVGYFFKNGFGLRRFDASSHGPAGIAAPSAAPTLAEGAAGAIEAGDYFGVYRYRNSASGARSNYSPESAVLSLAADKKIDWTDLLESTTGQVDVIDLFRTAPNQLGQYLFVGTVDNGVSTFTDDVEQDQLGSPASRNDGLPPSAAFNIGEIWRERLWASEGIHAWYSEEGFPESWSGAFVPVFPEDGHVIRSLHGEEGRIYVGKTNAVHYIEPAGINSWARRTLSHKAGSVSHQTFKSLPGGFMIWLGPEDLYISNQQQVDGVGRPRIATILDGLGQEPGPSAQSRAAAVVVPENHWYLCSVPVDGATENSVVICHNYKTGKFALWDYPDQAPAGFAELLDTNFNRIYYAGFYDAFLYQLFQGNDDWGNALQVRLTTPDYIFRPGLQQALVRLHVLATTLSENLTIKLFRNGSSTAYKTRTVSLADGDGWHLYALSNERSPSNSFQVAIEYTGSSQVELEQLALEVTTFMRSLRAS